MRPSYDGEHPTAPTPTPIYDELYSEYRRLFRALPGDRSGEEDMRFTGFAVRDHRYPVDEYRTPYGGRPAYSHQQFEALPQHQSFPTYAGQLPGVPQFVPPQQQGAHHQQGHQNPQAQQGHQNQQGQHQTAHHPGAQQPAGQPQATGFAQFQQSPASPPSTGHGWVATGYLAPATAGPAAGRHRGRLLSLPPGRAPGHS